MLMIGGTLVNRLERNRSASRAVIRDSFQASRVLGTGVLVECPGKGDGEFLPEKKGKKYAPLAFSSLEGRVR